MDLAASDLLHSFEQDGLDIGEAKVPSFLDDFAVLEECAVEEWDGEQGTCGRMDQGAVSGGCERVAQDEGERSW